MYLYVLQIVALVFAVVTVGRCGEAQTQKRGICSTGSYGGDEFDFSLRSGVYGIDGGYGGGFVSSFEGGIIPVTTTRPYQITMNRPYLYQYFNHNLFQYLCPSPTF